MVKFSVLYNRTVSKMNFAGFLQIEECECALVFVVGLIHSEKLEFNDCGWKAFTLKFHVFIMDQIVNFLVLLWLSTQAQNASNMLR